MKREHLLRAIVVALVAMVALRGAAAEEVHDTVYFYNTWEQMLMDRPAAMFIDPVISVMPPYFNDFKIVMPEDQWNVMIRDKFIAAQAGSIWLINSTYLKRSFGWESCVQGSYVTLFFNDKVAYVDYEWPNNGWYDRDFFYIDFKQRKLVQLMPASLSALLNECGYYDLRMRYEGMKNYKSVDVIDDFFFQYIDRVTQDTNMPGILDYVE